MEFFQLDFYGLKKKLPITHISRDKKIANFNILGDVEFTEKAGEKLERVLHERKIMPECFVGPEVKVVPFVHHMAKRFNHNRYVILRKSIKGYMVSPIVKRPWSKAPKHVKKLVLNGADRDYLKGRSIVLVDDVVSTGVTMELALKLMNKIGAKVLAKCAIFSQGDRCIKDLICLAKLPIFSQV